MRQRAVFGGDKPLSKFLTLSSASLMAQLLPVISMPVLTRLYGSREFAAPALLSSALAVASTAACGRLDTAVMLSSDIEEAGRRFSLSMMFCSVISVMMAFVLTPLVYFDIVGGWAAFLPLVTFLNGSSSSLTAMALVKGGERSAASSNIIRAAAYASFQAVLFPLGGETAMTLAIPLSYVAGVCPLLRYRHNVSANGLYSEFKRLSRFTVFLLPGAFAVQAAFGIQSFVLTHRADEALLGAWWVVSRLLSAPLSVISTPAGQIFSRELSMSKAADRKRVFASFSVILGLAAGAMAVLFLFVSPMLPLLLGPGWEITGALLRISVPLFAVRLVAAPLSNTAVALGKYRAVMIWQLTLCASSVLCIVLTSDSFSYIVLSQSVLSVFYLAFFLYCRRIAAGERR